ncbi:hypothetical protein JCM16303_001328 [Sporobolomyces ruberrimus]
MGKISQARTASFLRKAQTDQEVEEILGAYLHSKQAKATHPRQVQRKLTLLACYLNAMGQREQTVRHAKPFATISSLAASSIPASNLVFPSTELGLEIWNEATREPRSWFRSPKSTGINSSSSSLSNF